MPASTDKRDFSGLLKMAYSLGDFGADFVTALGGVGANFAGSMARDVVGLGALAAKPLSWAYRGFTGQKGPTWLERQFNEADNWIGDKTDQAVDWLGTQNSRGTWDPRAKAVMKGTGALMSLVAGTPLKLAKLGKLGRVAKIMSPGVTRLGNAQRMAATTRLLGAGRRNVQALQTAKAIRAQNAARMVAADKWLAHGASPLPGVSFGLDGARNAAGSVAVQNAKAALSGARANWTPSLTGAGRGSERLATTTAGRLDQALQAAMPKTYGNFIQPTADFIGAAGRGLRDTVAGSAPARWTMQHARNFLGRHGRINSVVQGSRNALRSAAHASPALRTGASMITTAPFQMASMYDLAHPGWEGGEPLHKGWMPNPVGIADTYMAAGGGRANLDLLTGLGGRIGTGLYDMVQGRGYGYTDFGRADPEKALDILGSDMNAGTKRRLMSRLNNYGELMDFEHSPISSTVGMANRNLAMDAWDAAKRARNTFVPNKVTDPRERAAILNQRYNQLQQYDTFYRDHPEMQAFLDRNSSTLMPRFASPGINSVEDAMRGNADVYTDRRMTPWNQFKMFGMYAPHLTPVGVATQGIPGTPGTLVNMIGLQQALPAALGAAGFVERGDDIDESKPFIYM